MPEPYFSDDEFTHIFEDFSEMTRNAIASMQTEQLHPMLFVHDAATGAKVTMVDLHMAFIDDNLKFQAMFETGYAMYANGVEADMIFLVSEVWMSPTPVLDPDTKQPILRPRDDPTREEAIVMSAMSVDNKTCVALFDIIRDSTNQVHMGDRKKFEYDSSSDEKTKVESPLLKEFFRGYAKAFFEAMAMKYGEEATKQ